MKIDRLEYLLKTIPQLLSEEDEKEFIRKPSPNKWSKQEILGHLIDSATNNHQRFVRSQFENIPLIPYNQNEWNKCNYYNNFKKHQLISFWISYNEQILQLIQLIPKELLLKKCNTGNDSHTIEFLFDDYVEHLEHHLKQIVNTQ